MLPNNIRIRLYHFYTYAFLDDLFFIKDPYEYFQDATKEEIDDAILVIGDNFKQHGWEGDGEIGVIWLPPFVDVGSEDTWGTYIWHVKQTNNGISFLACDKQLEFDRLKRQNDKSLRQRNDLEPISIIETTVEWIKSKINNVEDKLKREMQFLSNTKSDSEENEIKKSLFFHYQSVLVRYFQEFLDDCYLNMLIEVIDNGNPHKIKLNKSKVTVDLVSYIPESDENYEDTTDSANNWFTLHGFISDIWKAYKWEPFKNKADMLFKSIDYPINEHVFYEIRKHNVIRNCMQHHEGCLDRDALKQLGRDKIQIKSIGDIEVWKPIELHESELYFLCTMLTSFVDDFNRHVKIRIPTVHFRKKTR